MALEQRIIDPEKEAAELNRRITELENLLLETENFRKKQFLISASSVLIILLILNFGGAFEILTQIFVWASLALTVISLITYIVQNKNVISMQE